MKRTEMLTKISGFIESITEGKVLFNETESDMLLTFIEQAGMGAPRLDGERCQAIMSTYYAGYTLNKWDEEFDKDSKVVEAYKKRMERKKR